MTSVGTSNISFSGLRNNWKAASYNGSLLTPPDPSDTGDTLAAGANIKLSDFRGAVMSSTNVPGGSAKISINTYFLNKEFEEPSPEDY